MLQRPSAVRAACGDVSTARRQSHTRPCGVDQVAARRSGCWSDGSCSPRATRESATRSPHMTGNAANPGATTAGVTRGRAG